jgi:uncharacterized protein (TIGR03437 family)
VETPHGVTPEFDSVMQPPTPGIFTLDASGTGQAVAFFAGTSDLAATRSFRAPGQPAQAGDHLSILVTGLTAAAMPTVSFGDVPAEVESVDPVPGYSGLYAIQVAVPAGSPVSGSLPLAVKMPQPDGSTVVSNSATVAVEAARP